MRWETEATAAVERAPFFVRRFVRKKVEEYVRNKGGDVVTLADVNACKSSFLASRENQAPEPAPPIAAAPEPVAPEPVARVSTADLAGLSEADIRAIEKLTEEKTGVDTRFYAVQSCGGAVGCPLTLVDVAKVTDQLASILAESGVADYLRDSIKGPVLTHHKFRVAVSGCANCCSEPQIKDFALIARERPGLVDADVCTQCGQCVDACREEAIALSYDGPQFDYERCLSCGRCVQACPTEAIATVATGYDVLVGGKLGRHPQLATPLASMVNEEEAGDALRRCLAFYVQNADGPERFGALLNRTGLEAVRS